MTRPTDCTSLIIWARLSLTGIPCSLSAPSANNRAGAVEEDILIVLVVVGVEMTGVVSDRRAEERSRFKLINVE